jgi:antitoxin YefM
MAMRTANYSDLRKNLKHYLDQVIEDTDRLIIPRNGGDGVIMMSLREYNSIAETEYLMSSPAMMKAIREAEQDSAEGRFKRFETLEEMNSYLDKREKEIAKNRDNVQG